MLLMRCECSDENNNEDDAFISQDGICVLTKACSSSDITVVRALLDAGASLTPVPIVQADNDEHHVYYDNHHDDVCRFHRFLSGSQIIIQYRYWLRSRLLV
jgi:hypothetical protein